LVSFFPYLDVGEEKIALRLSSALDPDPVYLGNYVALFQKHPFGWWLGNTLAISAIVTALKLVIDGMAAYALAKLDFAGKPVIVTILLISVAVPLAALLIPLFLITRSRTIDTRLALSCPARQSARRLRSAPSSPDSPTN
jgi:ABC-type glycerol-3-phosphate transport system permease component